MRKHRNVDRPLAQRGQPNREGVDAVEQVLAEASVADEQIERPVGRRDQPEVDGDRSVAAEPLESALLEHAQQLGLRDDRQVADLVEEQRAVVGQFEAAGLAVVRAGEGALLVAEDLGFEQRVGQRRAVDRLELGAALRRDRSWIIRATSSLPDPVGPRISTEMSDLAAVRIHSKTTSIFSSRPIISRKRWTDGDWSSVEIAARRSRKVSTSGARRADPAGAN